MIIDLSSAATSRAAAEPTQVTHVRREKSFGDTPLDDFVVELRTALTLNSRLDALSAVDTQLRAVGGGATLASEVRDELAALQLWNEAQ